MLQWPKTTENGDFLEVLVYTGYLNLKGGTFFSFICTTYANFLSQLHRGLQGIRVVGAHCAHRSAQYTVRNAAHRNEGGGGIREMHACLHAMNKMFAKS